LDFYPYLAQGKCRNNAPVQLHELDRRDSGMTEAPQILLQHHLKKLRLPTFQGEYAKQAKLCAAENNPSRVLLAIPCRAVDHIQYLARLCEMEVIDRERRMIERRIRCLTGDVYIAEKEGGKVPQYQKPSSRACRHALPGNGTALTSKSCPA
jgi:hypothetical protein